MIKLEIYVMEDCWSCAESRRIAAEVQARFGEVEVVLLDLASERRPPEIFAAPTYLLDGKVISLGNPRREELWQQITQRIHAPETEEV